MMDTTVGDFENGQVKIKSINDNVVVSIHWPFDRDLDEWIDISANFLRTNIRSASRMGNDIYVESDNGHLRIADQSAEESVLEFAGRNALGPSSAELKISKEMADEIRAQITEV
jgi:hypothetical protein